MLRVQYSIYRGRHSPIPTGGFRVRVWPAGAIITREEGRGGLNVKGRRGLSRFRGWAVGGGHIKGSR